MKVYKNLQMKERTDLFKNKNEGKRFCILYKKYLIYLKIKLKRNFYILYKNYLILD